MAIIKSAMEIDAAQALSTLNKMQSAFTGYNSAIGTVTSQVLEMNKGGKAAVVTFSQVSSAGQKVTSTVRQVGLDYDTLKVKVSAATNAQRRFAAEMEKQKTLADQVAAAIKTAPATPGVVPHRPVTTFPGVVDPAKIGLAAAAFGKITKEQFNAALAARGFSTAQIDALGKTFASAQRVTTVFRNLGGVVDSFRAKWAEVGKITFATAIYRGISLLQLGLTQGIQTAGEFSKQIGLIQTLASGASDNFNTWSASIRAVADEFGRPVTEVAAATYDALSNQIIETTADMDKLRIAAELARNTNTSVGDSVNVLSSVLNAFGTDAGSARQISDELFTTIDLGRVRINELNGVVGRSSSIAKTAGVSFRELEAGLIVLTQQGLNSAEAATLLNNVYSQIVKPNEALSAQFKKMGFDSGTAAVEVLGFAGVMRELHRVADQTAQGISIFFPEIRGLRGAATFAAEGIDKLDAALVALEKSQGANSKATETLNKNIGQNLADEIQRVQNFFTVDLGQAVLGAVASISSTLGGLANSIKLITTLFIDLGAAIVATFVVKGAVSLITTIGILAEGFVRLTSAVGLANLATVAFGVTLKGLQAAATLFLSAFSVGFVAASVILSVLDDVNRAAAAKLAAAFEKNRIAAKEAAEKEASERTIIFEKSVDSMTRSYGRFIARVKAANTEMLESLNKTADSIADRLQNAFGVFTSIAGANLKKHQSDQEKLINFVTGLQKSQAERYDEIQQGIFERQMARISEINGALQQQGGNAANQAIAAVKARNLILERQIKIAIDNSDLEQTKRLATEIFRNFERLGEFKVTGINKSIAAAEAIIRQLEAEHVEKQRAGFGAAAAEIVKEKIALKDLEDLFKEIATFTTKKVQLKEGGLAQQYVGDPEKALTDLKALREKADAEINKLVLRPKDPLGIEQAKAALKEINAIYIEQRQNLANILDTFARDQAATKFSEARQKEGEVLKKLNADLNAQLLEQKDILQANTQLVINLAEQIRRQVGGGLLGKSAGGISDLLANFGEGFDKKTQGQVKALSELIRDLAIKDTPAAQRAFTQLFDVIKKNAPNLKIFDPLDPNTLITYTEAVKRIGTALDFIAEAQRQIGQTKEGIGTISNELVRLRLEETAFLKAVDPALAAILEKERSIVGETEGISEHARAWNNLALAIAGAARAAENFRAFPPLALPKIPLGQVEEKAEGGLVGSRGGFLANFFAGRYARGTDVIPVMLSKGEFVVKAPMAERYYSQLLAINSGHARSPLYKSQGGSVTNNTVGDLHFTVQGGGSAKMAREIMGHIRRAQKQGTGRIN
jgi:TP901 family phage tail tape measure protein